MMKHFYLFCLVIGLAMAGSWFPPDNDKSCKFTRADALSCAMRNGDTNRDGRLDRDEIAHALATMVPGYIRVAAWFKGVDLARALTDCDYNKDGVITPRDWELATKTCMPRQEDLCKFKWFCDRVNT